MADSLSPAAGRAVVLRPMVTYVSRGAGRRPASRAPASPRRGPAWRPRHPPSISTRPHGYCQFVTRCRPRIDIGPRVRASCVAAAVSRRSGGHYAGFDPSPGARLHVPDGAGLAPVHSGAAGRPGRSAGAGEPRIKLTVTLGPSTHADAMLISRPGVPAHCPFTPSTTTALPARTLRLARVPPLALPPPHFSPPASSPGSPLSPPCSVRLAPSLLRLFPSLYLCLRQAAVVGRHRPDALPSLRRPLGRRV